MPLFAVRWSALLCRTKPTGGMTTRPNCTDKRTQNARRKYLQRQLRRPYKQRSSGTTLSSPAAKSENQAAKTDKMNTAFCGQVERLVVAKLNRLRRDSCARKYLQQRRNAENAETQKLPERNHACRAEAQTLHENKNAAPPKRRRAKFTRKTKASTATPQNRFKHAARFATTPSSPAAKSGAMALRYRTN